MLEEKTNNSKQRGADRAIGRTMRRLTPVLFFFSFFRYDIPYYPCTTPVGCRAFLKLFSSFSCALLYFCALFVFLLLYYYSYYLWFYFSLCAAYALIWKWVTLFLWALFCALHSYTSIRCHSQEEGARRYANNDNSITMIIQVIITLTWTGWRERKTTAAKKRIQ